MSILHNASRQVNRCVVLFTPALIRRHATFGLGVFPTRPATAEEIAARYLETTYSVEEKKLADRFNLTLAEARTMLAEGEDAIRDAEMDRLDAWDAVNEADPDRWDEIDVVDTEVLTIGGNAYAVSEIPAGEFGSKAFRMTKGDGTAYDLIRDHGELLRCDCPHYLFKCEGTQDTCKHGDSLVRAGLIAAPTPVSRRRPGVRHRRVNAALAKRKAVMA